MKMNRTKVHRFASRRHSADGQMCDARAYYVYWLCDGLVFGREHDKTETPFNEISCENCVLCFYRRCFYLYVRCLIWPNTIIDGRNATTESEMFTYFCLAWVCVHLCMCHVWMRITASFIIVEVSFTVYFSHLPLSSLIYHFCYRVLAIVSN